MSCLNLEKRKTEPKIFRSEKSKQLLFNNCLLLLILFFFSQNFICHFGGRFSRLTEMVSPVRNTLQQNLSLPEILSWTGQTLKYHNKFPNINGNDKKCQTSQNIILRNAKKHYAMEICIRNGMALKMGILFKKNASFIVLLERLTKNVRFSRIKYSIKQGGNYDRR